MTKREGFGMTKNKKYRLLGGIFVCLSLFFDKYRFYRALVGGA
jgi:hypothetical protein